MNKKLLTMAVGTALAFGAATAQAEATVYGHLQVEMGNFSQDSDTGPGNSVLDGDNDDNASGWSQDDNKRGRLGIKASEDLGGGMSAIAKFEWQVDTSDGDANDGARESWVGLKGGFGTIKLGRLQSPWKYMGGVKYDAFVTTFAEARGTNGGMLGNGVTLNTSGANNDASNYMFNHGFWSDAISYRNKFAGMVDLWINYRLQDNEAGDAGADTDFTETETSGDYQVGVMIGQGPWEVFAVLGHDELMESSGYDTQTSMDQTKFGGKFSFGGGGMKHTIMLQQEIAVLEADCVYNIIPGSGTFDSCAAPITGETEVANAFVGYQLGMGKTTFVVQAGAQVQERDNEDGVVNGEDEELTRAYTAVGVIHKFSKKSRVFAAYRTTDQETDEDVSGANDDTLDTSVLTVGLRQDF